MQQMQYNFWKKNTRFSLHFFLWSMIILMPSAKDAVGCTQPHPAPLHLRICGDLMHLYVV